MFRHLPATPTRPHAALKAVSPHASTLPGRDAPRNRLRWGRHPARCSARVVPCICTPNCTCTPPLRPATAPTWCQKELQRCNRFEPPCTLPRGRIGPKVSSLLHQHEKHTTSNSENACGDQRRNRTPRSEAQQRGRVGCYESDLFGPWLDLGRGVLKHEGRPLSVLRAGAWGRREVAKQSGGAFSASALLPGIAVPTSGCTESNGGCRLGP